MLTRLSSDNIVMGVAAFMCGVFVSGLFCFFAAFDLAVSGGEFYHNGDLYITMSRTNYEALLHSAETNYYNGQQTLDNLKIDEDILEGKNNDEKLLEKY